jgi:hypothetical protein
MKTKLLLFSLLISVFAAQIQAQNRTVVNASNAEISDNLDLRAVASIFGDSQNIQDFERRLNDPQLQISNLDLNSDDQVDYLRVLETVEQRTHLIVIQAVLDRDVYQDVATIDLEKDRSNNIHVQIVGNSFMYGQNYIYEPVYFNTPVIYNSFWTSNYRPYYSTWNWNYYPSYYHTWNPFPVFRYRSNINICFTNNNYYNYVNERRSVRAVVLYDARRSNGYERLHPEYSFSRRNVNINNRYELVQGRISRNEIGYRDRNTAATRDYVQGNRSSRETAARTRLSDRDNSDNRSSQTTERNSPRMNATTTTSRNRSNSSVEASPRKLESTNDYSRNRGNSLENTKGPRSYSQNRNSKETEGVAQRTQSMRDYSQNRNSQKSEGTAQRSQSTRDYSQNRNSQASEGIAQRKQSTRDYSQNRNSQSKEGSTQPRQSTRDYSQNRNSQQTESSPQRTESRRNYSQNSSTINREPAPERAENNNRGSSSRGSAPQKIESQRGNSSSRTSNRRS